MRQPPSHSVVFIVLHGNGDCEAIITALPSSSSSLRRWCIQLAPLHHHLPPAQRRLRRETILQGPVSRRIDKDKSLTQYLINEQIKLRSSFNYYRFNQILHSIAHQWARRWREELLFAKVGSYRIEKRVRASRKLVLGNVNFWLSFFAYFCVSSSHTPEYSFSSFFFALAGRVN